MKMGRLPKVVKMKENKKGAWSEEEDIKLKNFLENEGGARGLNWDSISHKAGLNRCGKSCRLRWKNYLHPHIKRGNFSPQEEEIIIRHQSHLGNKWAQIAAQLPGRTDNDIKNLWNTKLRKKLQHEALSQQLQTPFLTENHYNLFSNGHAIAEAANNSLLQQWIMKLNQEWSWLQLQIQLQTMDPLLPVSQPLMTSDDAWVEGGLSENAFDSNVDAGYNCDTLPALVSPTDDHHQNPLQISDEFFVNGIGNEMDCEFLASTSNTYGGATCSFYHDFGVNLSE